MSVNPEASQVETNTTDTKFKPRSKYKNQQMDDVIKLVTSNEFGPKRQKEIMECIRAFQIDLRHVQEVKKVFIDCDLDGDGNTTYGQFSVKL